MPCQDCERAIAELRAELDALEQRHERRQQAMADAMDKLIDNIAAKNQTLGWIDEHCHTHHSGNQLAQEFQPLCLQLAG
jgi:hypothetical protein